MKTFRRLLARWWAWYRPRSLDEALAEALYRGIRHDEAQWRLDHPIPIPSKVPDLHGVPLNGSDRLAKTLRNSPEPDAAGEGAGGPANDYRPPDFTKRPRI